MRSSAGFSNKHNNGPLPPPRTARIIFLPGPSTSVPRYQRPWLFNSPDVSGLPVTEAQQCLQQLSGQGQLHHAQECRAACPLLQQGNYTSRLRVEDRDSDRWIRQWRRKARTRARMTGPSGHGPGMRCVGLLGAK